MNNFISLSALITIAIFSLGVTYHVGRVSSRVESLEVWRDSVRKDMHEISDKLETMSNNIREIMTMIAERTERRGGMREK